MKEGGLCRWEAIVKHISWQTINQVDKAFCVLLRAFDLFQFDIAPYKLLIFFSYNSVISKSQKYLPFCCEL